MYRVVSFLFLFPIVLQAQLVRVSGVVTTAENESLPLAHVVVMPDSVTAVSDRLGKFTVSVERGPKQLLVTYTGFQSIIQTVEVRTDTLLNFALTPEVRELEEVVIASKPDLQTALFESSQSSTNMLEQQDIAAIPVLGGEADPIKVLQLLPGTLRGVEGSADLFVRGGAADQNLVLLDGAPVYNTSHLFGFVSVFNPDILSTVKSVNGGFPASMGGRLSSIIDVTTNNKIADETYLSGEIGLIASRFYAEQPIIKDKASIWIGGRRTYIDQVVKLVSEELPYFFYDINARLLVKPTDRDEFSLSVFYSRDILELFRDRNNDGRGFLTVYDAGNTMQSFQWNRTLSGNWKMHSSLHHTAFQYEILNAFRDNRVLAFSDIRDVSGKWSLEKKSLSKQTTFSAGAEWTRHDVSPSVVNANGTFAELLAAPPSRARVANEMAAFALYEWNLSPRLRVNSGLRFSIAQVDGKIYTVPEPRLSFRYEVNETSAIKWSYSRTAQYMHRVSNSAVTSPTDIWYPVTDSIRPQTAHQFAAAWQQLFPDEKIMVSMEAYYKPMQSLVGLEEGTNLFFNTEFESKLIQGRGRAYGLELLVRKEAGKLTGWVSYTLSWTNRQFDDINNGLWFPSRYDRRHNGAIVAQYALHNRWSASLVWEYISGSRFTPVVGQYVVTAPSTTGVDLLPVYAPVNSVKLANTHRLDLGVKFRSLPQRKFQYEWFAGVYNAYNRANPVGITIEENEADGSIRYEQPGLFGLLPFISYKFKF